MIKGVEWVRSIKNTWHYPASKTCSFLTTSGNVITAVSMFETPPVEGACIRCTREWKRRHEKPVQ